MDANTLVYWFLWFAAYSFLTVFLKRRGWTFAYWVGLTLVIHFGGISVLKYQLMSQCEQFESPSVSSLPNQVLVLHKNTPVELAKYPRETSRGGIRWDWNMLRSHFGTIVAGYDDSDDGKLVACGEVADVSMSLSECEAANKVMNISVTRTYERGDWANTYRIRIFSWTERSGIPELLAVWEQLTMTRRAEWVAFLPFSILPPRTRCSTNGQTAEEWLIDLTSE